MAAARNQFINGIIVHRPAKRAAPAGTASNSASLAQRIRVHSSTSHSKTSAPFRAARKAALRCLPIKCLRSTPPRSRCNGESMLNPSKPFLSKLQKLQHAFQFNQCEVAGYEAVSSASLEMLLVAQFYVLIYYLRTCNALHDTAADAELPCLDTTNA